MFNEIIDNVHQKYKAKLYLKCAKTASERLDTTKSQLKIKCLGNMKANSEGLKQGLNQHSWRES